MRWNAPPARGGSGVKWSTKHPVYLEIWERDKGTCQRCGKPGHQEHHIRPADRRENVVCKERIKVVCCDCHGEIHAHPAMSYEDGWLLPSWARFRCPDCLTLHGNEHGKRTLSEDDPRCPTCSATIEEMLNEVGAG